MNIENAFDYQGKNASRELARIVKYLVNIYKVTAVKHIEMEGMQFKVMCNDTELFDLIFDFYENDGGRCLRISANYDYIDDHETVSLHTDTIINWMENLDDKCRRIISMLWERAV